MLLLSWAALFGDPPRVAACAPAMRPGDEVSIAGEEALIVWSSSTRRQHFLRRADFHTDAEDFGFLVPTPTEPELDEAPDDIFDRLRAVIAPDTETSNEWTPVTCCTAPFELLLAGGRESLVVDAAPAVRVLSEQRVAGLDATVLEADDAEALAAWLGEHGYVTRSALEEWLRPYVAAGFKITAFKYAKGEGTDSVGSRTVRMSFTADRPFYPYREPSDHQGGPGRSLRLHVVADARLEGAFDGGGPWSAPATHAAPFSEASAVLAQAVPAVDIPAAPWLTSFLDTSETRPPHDVRFRSAADQSETRPPPRVERVERVLPLPVEPVVIGVGVLIWIRRRRRQRRGQGTAA